MNRLIHKLHQKKCDRSGRTIDRNIQQRENDSTSSRNAITYIDRELVKFGKSGNIIDTQIL